MELCNLFFITSPMKLKHSYPNLKTQAHSVKCLADTNRRLKLAESLQYETFRILEWPSVCNQVSSFTATSMGTSAARDGLVPIGRSPEESRRLLNQTSAAFALPFPLDFSGIEDVSDIIESSVALEEDFSQIGKNCNFLTDLEQKIEYCIDSKFSTILDRASEDLEIIRSERKSNMEDLDSLLKDISTKIFLAGGIDKPLVTKRRSRMCVGIRASHKSLLPNGVVLDVSSSGATYFMEPKEAVDLNNMEVRLSNAERVEEQAILGLLTSEISQSESEINYLLDRVLEVDFAIARAAHARWINGVCPLICGSGSVDIEGPNTGGKTASMKTLGLASIMLKAGMYLPATNQPTLPWFDLILADIGDHQSLEQSLSTFSGHLSRICKMLEVTSKQSLILIDEIGSGTDPSEGVALSTSMLEYVKDRVNLAVTTTHYADLSLLKENNSQYENAAMEFSLETLQPTYKILWGSTGESNALTIAKSIGFDEKIVERAQTWVKRLMPDKAEKRKGLLYQSLMEEKNRLEIQANKAADIYSNTMTLYNEIRDEADDLVGREAALKAKETQKIQKEIATVKSQLEKIVEDFEARIRSASIDQLNTLLKESESAISSIVECHKNAEESSVIKTDRSTLKVKLGDQVIVTGLGNKQATIVEPPGTTDGTALVQYGKIRVRVNLNTITPLPNADIIQIANSKSNVKKQGGTRRIKSLKNLSEGSNSETVSYGPVLQTSKNTVDLRGMRVEEASHNLNLAINITGSNSVLFVIHGMGTGVVKECALQILKKHPRVVKFEQDGPTNYGCTVAYIK
ncbi:unnamed protein product [Lactuca saligna]|uniref:Smr domain-containing protein n=1 Tax=Lactuca saligna TaxID=75948 RepID=A0AA36E2L6_LACSI|nr:unnamed protein product [Lactuca saligna]